MFFLKYFGDDLEKNDKTNISYASHGISYLNVRCYLFINIYYVSVQRQNLDVFIVFRRTHFVFRN